MFVEHVGSDGTPQVKKKIQTSFWVKMGQFKVVSCFRKKTKANEQLDIGNEKLDNLLDIFGMFKTVQKLKVLVSLLVPKDQKETLLAKAENLYVHEMTIWTEAQA
jgi:hypothetical protein